MNRDAFNVLQNYAKIGICRVNKCMHVENDYILKYFIMPHNNDVFCPRIVNLLTPKSHDNPHRLTICEGVWNNNTHFLNLDKKNWLFRWVRRMLMFVHLDFAIILISWVVFFYVHD